MTIWFVYNLRPRPLRIRVRVRIVNTSIGISDDSQVWQLTLYAKHHHTPSHSPPPGENPQ